MMEVVPEESPPRAIGGKHQHILRDFHQGENAHKGQYEPFPTVWSALLKYEVVLV